MRSLQTVLGLLTLVAIGMVVLWESERRTSPGPLHPSHAALADFLGSAGCVHCHGDGAGKALADACAECHAAVAGQITTSTGVHGAVANVAQCGRCHMEHHGDSIPLVDERTFARAGIENLARDAHAHVAAFGLSGAHTALACVKCHEQADAPHLEAGKPRYLGLEQTCTNCHTDSHDGEFGADCASCHGQERPFDQVGEFRHRSFAIDGAHAALACVRCHAPDGAHAIARLQGRDPPARSCATCHGDPHGVDMRALPLNGAIDCAGCHSTAAFRGAEFGIEQHARIDVALEGAHTRARCDQCHTSARATRRATRGPQPTPAAMNRCLDCHEPAHGASGTALPLAGADNCARCHGVEDFAAVRFGVTEHRERGVDLVGAHARAECRTCHIPERDRGSAITVAANQRMTACTACHDSPHAAALTASVARLERLVGDAACALCHDADAAHFRIPDARMDARVHADLGFPLVAPHGDVACAVCHTADAGTFTARFPGRDADTCAVCHPDPHGGQFQGADAATDCLRCHARTVFLPPQFDVERHADCGFPLSGSHRAVACTACHGRDGEAPRRFAGTPTACASCHADPHAGRFDLAGMPREVDGRTGCARCHGEDDFLGLRDAFDHDRWTGFALHGTHARTACTDCHGRSGAPDAHGRTLGKAPPRCADCHTDVHGSQFARGTPLETDCARCHSDATSFQKPHFDHARDSRFALDATHGALACSACHRRESLPDGRSIPRYRPLGTACTDCHGGRAVRR